MIRPGIGGWEMSKSLVEEAEEKWREEFPNRVNIMKKILSEENDSLTPYIKEELGPVGNIFYYEYKYTRYITICA